MKNGFLAVLFTFVFSLPANADHTPEHTLNAVVKIRSTVPDSARTARILGTEREGNGVVIDPDGLIVTIGYLILEAETIEVFPHEGDPVRATFVGYDHKTGFGLLRANKRIHATPMELGQSAALKEGDPILTVGYGGSDAVQGARVISRKEFVGYWEYLLENALYVSPPHPSYGGAALIGRNGELLGIGSIYTHIVRSGYGAIPCNMFVPIDRLKPILTDMIAAGRYPGKSQPWLGLHADESHGRVFIIRVTVTGPADQAGLRPGDLILAVDQNPVQGLADFYRKVWALGNAGVKVPLSVLRGTQVREINVRSGDRYDFFPSPPRP